MEEMEEKRGFNRLTNGTREEEGAVFLFRAA